MYKIMQSAILVCFLTSFLLVQGPKQTIADIVASPSEDSYVPGEMFVKYKPHSDILTSEYYREQTMGQHRLMLAHQVKTS